MKPKILFRILFSIIILIAGLLVLKRNYAFKIYRDVLDITYYAKNENELKKGIQQLDKAIRLAPRNYIFYATRADLNLKLRDYNQTIRDYDRILDFKPDYAEGYLFQGMLYDWIDSDDSAKYCYDISIELYEKRIAKR
jgi:tetratricopeptide (TPR) repeat protein